VERSSGPTIGLWMWITRMKRDNLFNIGFYLQTKRKLKSYGDWGLFFLDFEGLSLQYQYLFSTFKNIRIKNGIYLITN
jgi:hypothetical protein